ncbi:MAG: COX15/CtaA family protein [Burkholderiales bacterium]|jgi:cytochrome c oxidase assembly protein subunit 15
MRMSAIEHGVVGLITLVIIVGACMWIGRDQVRFRRLITVTAVTTFVLIILGAYVRLSDAGLGCPDWPGCYGNLTPHHSTEEIRAAEAALPGGPVTMAKAWKEMAHRYLAMVVGALIAAIMFAAWRNRRRFAQSPALATVIAAAVIFQAALGAWTVTMLLKPAIVTSHLLGGVAILTLLILLLATQPGAGKLGERIIVSSRLKLFAVVAAVVLFMQIVLGGWTSTNYAALACVDLPTCNGKWLPEMDFANAFHVIRPLGVGPDGELLTIDALRAIHWMHRLGAIVVVLVVGFFSWRLAKTESGRMVGKMLGVMLALQVLLGLSNVWFSLPIWVSVAHNGLAALLMALIVVTIYRMNRT